jgi:hypothetical protein
MVFPFLEQDGNAWRAFTRILSHAAPLYRHALSRTVCAVFSTALATMLLWRKA